MVKYHLYGLQRSGTNILECFILDNFGIQVDTHQKHFRIQKLKAMDFEGVIKYFSRPDNSKHIVIIKDIYAWLLSIEAWAIKKKWDKTDKMDHVDDYIKYVRKWKSIKNDNLLIINYNDFLLYYSKINSPFIKNLETFLNKKCHGTKKRKSVKCTGRWGRNERFYLEKKYMKKYSPQEIKLIQTKLKK